MHSTAYGCALTPVNQSRAWRHSRRRGFSLVELVIVIVIIAVLAAIAVPRFSKSVGTSRESSLVGSLGAFRNAIVHYTAEHDGVFPGAAADGAGGNANSPEAFVSQLTLYSASDGRVSATAGGEFLFGPYLRQIPGVPVGPNIGSAVVAINTSNSPPIVTGNTEGWVYNPTTGEIIANTDEANIAGTRAYDEY